VGADKLLTAPDNPPSLDLTLSALRDALRGADNRTLTDLFNELSNIRNQTDKLGFFTDATGRSFLQTRLFTNIITVMDYTEIEVTETTYTRKKTLNPDFRNFSFWSFFVYIAQQMRGDGTNTIHVRIRDSEGQIWAEGSTTSSSYVYLRTSRAWLSVRWFGTINTFYIYIDAYVDGGTGYLGSSFISVNVHGRKPRLFYRYTETYSAPVGVSTRKINVVDLYARIRMCLIKKIRVVCSANTSLTDVKVDGVSIGLTASAGGTAEITFDPLIALTSDISFSFNNGGTSPENQSIVIEVYY